MSAITPESLRAHPEIISALRMSTSPPLAKDRLIGLTGGGSKNLLNKMEKEGKFPSNMKPEKLNAHLFRMCSVISSLLDLGLFEWCLTGGEANRRQRDHAVTVVADRLCGSLADPIVRNAQEQRQLALIEKWLTARGYIQKQHPLTLPVTDMEPGTFSFRQIVVVGDDYSIKIPVDVAIQPHSPMHHRFPVLVEAKSAGDFTNTNKRRKEESHKLSQLRHRYGDGASLLLFLCGYFDTGYLRYSAAGGLDWVWEHRIDDLEAAGV
jgi:hypothetical protein